MELKMWQIKKSGLRCSEKGINENLKIINCQQRQKNKGTTRIRVGIAAITIQTHSYT